MLYNLENQVAITKLLTSRTELFLFLVDLLILIWSKRERYVDRYGEKKEKERKDEREIKRASKTL